MYVRLRRAVINNHHNNNNHHVSLIILRATIVTILSAILTRLTLLLCSKFWQDSPLSGSVLPERSTFSSTMMTKFRDVISQEIHLSEDKWLVKIIAYILVVLYIWLLGLLLSWALLFVCFNMGLVIVNRWALVSKGFWDLFVKSQLGMD